MRAAITIFLTFIGYGLAVGQGFQPIFQNYTVEDGLPSSTVYDVMQDSRGYIWFGTDRGVSRFDGTIFENFDHRSGLPDSDIFESYEDSFGRIWFVPRNCELAYYDYKDDRIHLFAYNNLISQVTRPFAMVDFAVDEYGAVHFALGRIKIIIDTHGAIDFGCIKNNEDLQIEEVNGKTFLWNCNNKYPTRSISVGTSTIDSTFDLASSFQRGLAQSQNLDVVKFEDKIVINYCKNIVVLESDCHPKVIDLAYTGTFVRASRNILWAGTFGHGVFGYQIEGGKFIRQYKFLDKMVVSSFWQDRNGGYWFTTIGEGVFYTPSVDILAAQNLEGSSIGSLQFLTGNKKGQIFVGTKAGEMLIFDTQKYSFFRVQKPRLFGLRNHRTASSATYDYKRKSYWIASSPMYELDSTLAWHKVRGLRKGFFSGAHTIEVNGNEVLGLGIYGYSKTVDQKVVYDSDLLLNDPRRYAVAEQNTNGDLFLGNEAGLFAVKADSVFFLGKNQKAFSNEVSALQSFRNGLLVGTKGFGLHWWRNENLDQLTAYSDQPVKPDTSFFKDRNIIDIEVEDAKTVWVATEWGLNKIVWQTDNCLWKSTLFSHFDGLPFDIKSLHIDGDIIWMSSEKGIVQCRISALTRDTVAPILDVTKIDAGGRLWNLDDNIVLQHDSANISITCSSIDFRDPRRIILRANFPFSVSERREEGKGRYEFTSYDIPPGKYHCTLYSEKRAFGDNHPLNPKSKVIDLNFRVLAPYYKELWFIFLMILIAIVIIIGVAILIMMSFLRRLTIAKEINESKHQALAAQMSPHFVFNSLNSISSFVIQNDRVKSYKFLGKFARLMRSVLDNSFHKLVLLEKEIESVKLYLELERMRFPDKFDFEVIVGEMVDPSTVKIPPLVFQQFLENSIWHGIMNKQEGLGLISLEITRSSDFLFCQVLDNGVGMEKAAEIKLNKKSPEHNSVGVELTARRLELVEQMYKFSCNLQFLDVIDNKGKVAGTAVTFKLPIIRSHEDS